MQVISCPGFINVLHADGIKFAHPLTHLKKSAKDLPLLAIDSFTHMYLFPDIKRLRLGEFFAESFFGLSIVLPVNLTPSCSSCSTFTRGSCIASFTTGPIRWAMLWLVNWVYMSRNFRHQSCRQPCLQSRFSKSWNLPALGTLWRTSFSGPPPCLIEQVAL